MTEFIIRPIRIEDAEEVNMIRRQRGSVDNTYALPSERISFSRSFLEKAAPDDHLLVAEQAGRIIGLAGLHAKTGRVRHSATFGIIIHEDFQRQGVGKALLNTLLDLADNYLGLHRVELEVVEDNQRAINLYQSCGFELEGRKRQAYFRGGQFWDMLIMARIK